MRRYQLYQNPFEASRSFAPYVVVLSSHLLDVGTAIVAPLLSDAERAVTELHVTVKVEGGRSFIVAVHDLAAVDRALLRHESGDLNGYADALGRAVDRLFTGF